MMVIRGVWLGGLFVDVRSSRRAIHCKLSRMDLGHWTLVYAKLF